MSPINRHKLIIEIISENHSIGADYLAKKCNVSIITIKRDLKKLSDAGQIKYVGSAKKGRWIIIEKKQ
ncbi:MAG TPA: HTH domain-containing protein [Bacilli bacterium]|nr:HTH domain-containing protein [Bacilli bacterium]